VPGAELRIVEVSADVSVERSPALLSDVKKQPFGWSGYGPNLSQAFVLSRLSATVFLH
jgi:hypothetical protein